MSRFKTTILVDVAAVLAQLPERSYVEIVQLSEDRKTVEVVWGCDDLASRYTFPEPARVEDLETLRAKADATREAKLKALKGESTGEPTAEKADKPQIGNDKVSVDTRGRRGRKAV